MLLALMVLLSYFVVGVREEDSVVQQQTALRTHYAGQPEYRTRWTDKEHFSAKRILLREKKLPAPAQIVKGKGSVTVNGSTLDIRATTDLTLRLDHFYFPGWYADGMTLYPEDGSGQILLDVPAGNHRLTPHYSIWLANTLLIGLSGMVSILAALYLVMPFAKTRTPAKTNF
jgi:hypothetical protein